MTDHGTGVLGVCAPAPAPPPRKAQFDADVGDALLAAAARVDVDDAFVGFARDCDDSALLLTPIRSARHSALTLPMSSTATYTFL
jgi:hypothetical protein